MTSAPPPFDPEPAAALELIREMISPEFTLDDIGTARQSEGIRLLAELSSARTARTDGLHRLLAR